MCLQIRPIRTRGSYVTRPSGCPGNTYRRNSYAKESTHIMAGKLESVPRLIPDDVIAWLRQAYLYQDGLKGVKCLFSSSCVNKQMSKFSQRDLFTQSSLVPSPDSLIVSISHAGRVMIDTCCSRAVEPRRAQINTATSLGRSCVCQRIISCRKLLLVRSQLLQTRKAR